MDSTDNKITLEDTISILQLQISTLKDKLDIDLFINKNIITAEIKEGEIFGSQPFLAIKDKKNNYYHDNFDVVVHGKKWTYVLDNQTINKKSIKTIAIGSAGKYGKYVTKKIELS